MHSDIGCGSITSNLTFNIERLTFKIINFLINNIKRSMLNYKC